MTPEERKAIVRRWLIGICDEQNFALFGELASEQYVYEAVGHGAMPGLQCCDLVRAMHTAFPDLHNTIEQQVAEGGNVVTRGITTGTQRGVFGEIPASGKAVAVPWVVITTFKDDRIVRDWELYDASGMMSQLGALSEVESNKILARRFIEEVHNKRDWAVAKEILADDFVHHAWHWPDARGWQGLKRLMDAIDSVFADAQYTIQDLITEQDRVIVYWKFSGISRGELMGFPATGKPGSAEGATTLRIAGGKIVGHSAQWDALGLLQSIGAWAVHAHVQAEPAG